MLTNWTGSAKEPARIDFQDRLGAVHGMFTFRHGGVSQAPFNSLNLGYHVPDDASLVQANRERCADWMDTNLSAWVVPEQVHGNQVAVVSAADRGRGATPDHRPIPEVDALITDQPDVTLAVLSADCVPILFYDARLGAIGAAHSGWKGTVGHICQEVVRAMERSFGTRAQDLEVWLGPSVRRCCYEVDERVAGPVMEAFGPKPLVARHRNKGKYLLSLQACIRQDLLQVGIPSTCIHDVGVCSSCRTHQLFSHRAEHGKTGRFMGAIRLRGDRG